LELLARSRFTKTLYGAFFVIVVPLALVAWAHGANNTVHLIALHSVFWGAALIAFGVVVIALAMIALWIYGGGLPMNAFPPPRFVDQSIYSIVPHPIYGGFVIACAGVAVISGSATGLWLVTPTVALACAALVLGYEMPDLRSRFTTRKPTPWLPRDRPEAPSLLERLRIYPVILLPWLAIFEMLGALGRAPNSVGTYLPFEARLPIIEQTEFFYASTYIVVLFVPWLARSGTALRRFAQRGLAAMALIFPLYLLLPFFVPPRPFQVTTAIGHLLQLERTPNSGTTAFPSFHVAWALIAASALAEGSRWKKYFWWTWAVLVAISCITTGMHSLADVIAGIAAYIAVIRMPQIWQAILRAAERIANCWKEWRSGPVRIINHGGFAAAAMLFGILMIDTLLGPGRQAITISVFLGITVGALMWAQWVEGSPALLRPLGFYGAVIGATILGATSAFFFHDNLWTVLAAACIAAPVLQGIGRLRCLVQGCCHGRPVVSVPGIRHTDPHSRVCRLANLSGIPVHATPVYSILCNVVVELALLRLVQLHAACTLIFGIYFILSSAGRFAEEAYRGEPQTATIFGLHLYQWIAIVLFIVGAVITTIQSSPLPQITPLRMSSFLLALVCAAAAWFVTGIDFPESSRRFARLT
jgi:prolipoprotein diacylglyceryltransferase/membrane-associated phospholipid phosphatase/protein-S-isoprenylcysteine O-methyltransferase Ste14